MLSFIHADTPNQTFLTSNNNSDLLPPASRAYREILKRARIGISLTRALKCYAFAAWKSHADQLRHDRRRENNLLDRFEDKKKRILFERWRSLTMLKCESRIGFSRGPLDSRPRAAFLAYSLSRLIDARKSIGINVLSQTSRSRALVASQAVQIERLRVRTEFRLRRETISTLFLQVSRKRNKERSLEKLTLLFSRRLNYGLRILSACKANRSLIVSQANRLTLIPDKTSATHVAQCAKFKVEQYLPREIDRLFVLPRALSRVVKTRLIEYSTATLRELLNRTQRLEASTARMTVVLGLLQSSSEKKLKSDGLRVLEKHSSHVERSLMTRIIASSPSLLTPEMSSVSCQTETLDPTRRSALCQTENDYTDMLHDDDADRDDSCESHSGGQADTDDQLFGVIQELEDYKRMYNDLLSLVSASENGSTTGKIVLAGG